MACMAQSNQKKLIQATLVIFMFAEALRASANRAVVFDKIRIRRVKTTDDALFFLYFINPFCNGILLRLAVGKLACRGHIIQYQKLAHPYIGGYIKNGCLFHLSAGLL